MDNSVAGLSTTLIAALVAVIGWVFVHRLSAERDVANKRRDLRIQYLLDAYRRLESNANRNEIQEETNRAFESAVADIQLLGTKTQIEVLQKFLVAFHTKENREEMTRIDDVLMSLRTELRESLGLECDVPSPKILRLASPPKSEKPSVGQRS